MLPDPPGGISQILNTFMMWLLGIFGCLSIIAFVISGIQYFMAAGSEKMMQTAKRNMIYSILGVVVGLAGLVILTPIDNMLKANMTRFGFF